MCDNYRAKVKRFYLGQECKETELQLLNDEECLMQTIKRCFEEWKKQEIDVIDPPVNSQDMQEKMNEIL